LPLKENAECERRRERLDVGERVDDLLGHASEKYSFSLSPLRFAKGNTTIDGDAVRVWLLHGSRSTDQREPRQHAMPASNSKRRMPGATLGLSKAPTWTSKIHARVTTMGNLRERTRVGEHYLGPVRPCMTGSTIWKHAKAAMPYRPAPKHALRSIRQQDTPRSLPS